MNGFGSTSSPFGMPAFGNPFNSSENATRFSDLNPNAAPFSTLNADASPFTQSNQASSAFGATMRGSEGTNAFSQFSSAFGTSSTQSPSAFESSSVATSSFGNGSVAVGTSSAFGGTSSGFGGGSAGFGKSTATGFGASPASVFGTSNVASPGSNAFGSSTASSSAFPSVFPSASPSNLGKNSSTFGKLDAAGKDAPAVSSSSKPICRHFAVGNCRKGNSCEFQHIKSSQHSQNHQSKAICRYFAEGRCTKGADCAFRHELDSSPVRSSGAEVCSFYAQGRCTKGAACRYRHVDADRSSAKPQDDDGFVMMENNGTEENVFQGSRFPMKSPERRRGASAPASQHRESAFTRSLKPDNSSSKPHNEVWSIRVSNVPMSSTAGALKEHFEAFAPVIKVLSLKSPGQFTAEFHDRKSAVLVRRSARNYMGAVLSMGKPRLRKLKSSPNGTDTSRKPGSSPIEVSSGSGGEGDGDGAVVSRRERFATVPDARLEELAATRKSMEKQQQAEHGQQIFNTNRRHIVGTLMTMCSEEEARARQIDFDISAFEATAESRASRTNRVADFARCVKKYKRSAAAMKEPLPSLVRPPVVLAKTMMYLLDQVVDSIDHVSDAGENPFVHPYNFIRDRARSIRQDFTFQSYDGPISRVVHEMIVRFHILAQHELCELPRDDFDNVQNMEQLSQNLISLQHMYEDARSHGHSPIASEPEFQGYRLLANLTNADKLLRIVSSLPSPIFHSEPIQFSLDLQSAYLHRNYARFFSLIREKATYLQKCLLCSLFVQVRATALERIFRTMARGAWYPLSSLVSVLGFNDQDEAQNFVTHYGVGVETDDNGGRGIVKSKDSLFTHPASPYPRKFSKALIGVAVPSKRAVIIGDENAAKAVFGAEASDVSLPSPSPVASSSAAIDLSAEASLRNRLLDAARAKKEQEQKRLADEKRLEEEKKRQALLEEQKKQQHLQRCESTINQSLRQRIYRNVLVEWRRLTSLRLHEKERLAQKLAQEAREAEQARLRELQRQQGLPSPNVLFFFNFIIVMLFSVCSGAKGARESHSTRTIGTTTKA